MSEQGRGGAGVVLRPPVLKVSAGAQPESGPRRSMAPALKGAVVGVRMLPCVLLPLRAQAHWHLQLGRVGGKC